MSDETIIIECEKLVYGGDCLGIDGRAVFVLLPSPVKLWRWKF